MHDHTHSSVLPSCRTARQYAALAPDDELSVSESRLLRAHVVACPACGAFASDIEMITTLLQSEPLLPLELGLKGYARPRPPSHEV